MIDGGYGDTMSGKSQALERLAGHIHETSGKGSMVFISDGGAETYNSRGLVDDGVIKIFDFSGRDFPMTMLKLISEFYFPKDPLDPKSKLVAPPANLSETIGLIVFEGGSTIGSYLLSDTPGGLAWHAGQETGFGGIKDEDGVLSTTDDLNDVGDRNIQGATSPKHFMIAQRKIVTAIRKTKAFPGMVYWTFHPTEGPDRTQGGESGKFGKIEGKKIIGPDVAGRALASTIGREFGNLHHYDQVNIVKKEADETNHKQITKVEREFRLYTRRHFDPNQDVMIEYVAGSRIVGLKDYYVSGEPGDSLLQFYQDVKLKRQEKRK